MQVAFLLLTLGGIAIYSGLKGLSIIEVLAGKEGSKLDPKGGTIKTPPPPPTGSVGGFTGTMKAGGGWSGTKNIVQHLTRIALAQGGGMRVTSAKRPTVNTASGGMSDHFAGNPIAYAEDVSNGPNPTPEMDRAAVQIITELGGSYDGKSELVFTENITVDGKRFRVQVLYRTNVGGDHFDHIHVGVKAL